MRFLHFNYDKAKKLCSELGLVVNYDILGQADEQFEKHVLSQDQVDGIMEFYIRLQAILWNPKSYTLKQRLIIAFHFLFRKGLR